MDLILKYYGELDDRYKKMIESIRQQLGFTTLSYNRLDDMLDACGIDKDKLCTYCWNGVE